MGSPTRKSMLIYKKAIPPAIAPVAWVEESCGKSSIDGASGLIIRGQRRRYDIQTVHRMKWLLDSLGEIITASNRPRCVTFGVRGLDA